MGKVTVYTLSGCVYCARARRLLKRRRIHYEEISGEGEPGFRRLLSERAGGMTVPQILIDDEPIGGSDALAALDRAGVLLPRLAGERFPLATVRRRWSALKLLSAFVSLTVGGTREPWRHLVELRDDDGRVLDRQECSSNEEASELAGVLNGPPRL